MLPDRDPIVRALTQRRENLWLTRRGVEKRAGLGRGAIQRYEAGQRWPGPWALRRWADALGCDLVLVSRDGSTGVQRRPGPAVPHA